MIAPHHRLHVFRVSGRVFFGGSDQVILGKVPDAPIEGDGRDGNDQRCDNGEHPGQAVPISQRYGLVGGREPPRLGWCDSGQYPADDVHV